MTSYPDAIHQSWLPVASIKDIGNKPVSRLLHGVPIVLFRSDDTIVAMKDRCPHRNVPLSDGNVVANAIVCPYHGWAFGADGKCRNVPGSDKTPSLSAETLPVRIEAGLIFTNTSASPRPFVPLPKVMTDTSFDHFIWPVRSRALLTEAIENLLDPAHPHYVHAGLLRSDTRRNRVEVSVRQCVGSIEAIYREQRHANALIPRLIEGKRGIGIGRFLPPTTAQLVYEGEKGPKFVLTALFSPMSDAEVQVFACFSTPKGRLPAWFKERVLRLLNRPVLRQDQAVLVRQAETVALFGAPRFGQGPLDFLRIGIVRLMQGHDLEEQETRSECFL